MRRTRHLQRAVAVTFAVLVVVGAAAPSGAVPSGGHVLPGRLSPAGYSLTDMARELALFTTSGNDPAYYPQTPFQILYGDPATREVQLDGGGLLVTGRNRFVVCPGTVFFVPIFNVSDSPPVLGTFPTNPREARSYFFDPSQIGAQGFEIVVDGRRTPVGPAHLAGPVTTPPLLDGGGTHIITLGVFLSPMTPGVHRVTIRGGVFGDLVAETYGLEFFREEFTYTVVVTRHAGCR